MASSLLMISSRGCSRGGGRRGLEWVAGSGSHGVLRSNSPSTNLAVISNSNACWTSSFARRKANDDSQQQERSTIVGSAALLAAAAFGATFYNASTRCSSVETTSTPPRLMATSMALADTSNPFIQQRDVPAFTFEPAQHRSKARAARQKGEPYDISVRAIKGGRVTMEDEYYVAEGGRFVAVFDGHGGGGVSQFLKRNLYQEICKQLKEKHWEQSELEGSQASVSRHNSKRKKGEVPSVFTHVSALKSAFEVIDQMVLANDQLGYQGSTAVAVLVHENTDGLRTLLSANVGDSRAILSRNGKAINLTRDHKPNDETEKARILAMGETIEWDRYSKVHRVRNLSLSRAIGDRYAKPIVTGEVEIKHYPVTDDDEFVLLASDGLWDVMESDDVVRFVHQRIQEELARVGRDDAEAYRLVLRKNMAKFVAREAIRRGSGDNVCVCMVWLNDLEK